MEYAIELLPSYELGIHNMVRAFGIDSDLRTQEKYLQAHLGAGIHCDSVMSCTRKGDKLFEQQASSSFSNLSTGRPGLINVWPEFLHISVAFVNPPPNVSRDEADRKIRGAIKQDLIKLAEINASALSFSGSIYKGSAVGRDVWRIEADPPAWLRHLRDQVVITFQEHGWTARVPPCDERSRKVHMTIRDGGYRSAGSARKFDSKDNVIVIVDKLGVTPAAGDRCRHDSHRQRCGVTLTVSLGTKETVRHTFTDSGYAEDYPPLQKQRTKKSGRKPTLETRVIQPVEHGAEPAARAEVTTDALIADALLASTARDSDNVAGPAWVPGGQDGADGTFCASVLAGSEEEHATASPRQSLHIEQVDLLCFTFKRMKPGEFLNMLLQSEALQRHHIKHRSGANLFITGEQEGLVDQTLTRTELKPFHVVITSSLEAELERTLHEVPYRHRPRRTRSRPLAVGDFIAKRTFLCEAPVLREAAKQTQSTTEVTAELSVAHYSSARGINPRRAA